MLTPKQRAELKALAKSIEHIAERIGAEVVQCIGSKALLYKRNPKEPKIRLKNK